MGSSGSPLKGVESLHQLFGILHKRFVSFPPFIYLFNPLFMSLWKHGYFFYTLGYSPMLFY